MELKNRWRRIRVSLQVLALMLTLTFFSWQISSRAADEASRERFERQVRDVRRAIERHLQDYLNVLYDIRSLFSVREDLSQAEWKAYMKSLNARERYPGMGPVVFAPYVAQANKLRFERRFQTENSLDRAGSPGFLIKPAGERPDYFPIAYIEPLELGSDELGFDIGSDPINRKALEAARDDGVPIVTRGREGEAARRKELGIRVPVYRAGMAGGTVEERRRAFLGFIGADVALDQMMQDVLGGHFAEDLALRIYDAGLPGLGDPGRGAPLLYSSHPLQQADRLPAGARYRKEVSIAVPGDRWTLSFILRPDSILAADRRLPRRILVDGTFIGLLLSAITWSLGSFRQRAAESVESRSAPESEEKFRVIFEQAAIGIGLLTLEGRWLRVNQTICDILGFSQKELAGETLEQTLGRNFLKETPEHLLHEMDAREYPFTQREGSQKWLDLAFSTVRDFSGRPRYFIVVIKDVTGRRAAEKELSRRLAEEREARLKLQRTVETLQTNESRFRDVIESNVVGVAFADPDGLLRGANNAFLRLIGYTREELSAGTLRWGQLTSAKIRRFDNQAAEGPEEPGIGAPCEKEFIREDGSLVPVLIGTVRLEDSPGYSVCFIIDLTRRKQMEDELKNSREQLRNLTTRLQLVLEEERSRIAREIHDELGQLLTLLKMELSSAKGDRFKAKVESMSNLVDITLQRVREIATALRPGILDDLGLAAALQWQGEQFQGRTGILCELSVYPPEIPLDPERSTAIFRIFQETLTNIARHARADRVSTHLRVEGGQIILVVADNGTGITEEQISNSKSLGILGIRERAHLWGGSVKIEGIRGKGSTVRVSIPLPNLPKDRGRPEASK